MDVREKLVEMILSTDLSLSYSRESDALNIADVLIANGVTVQGWIPVTERLPDDSATVTLCTRSRIVGPGFYDKHTKTWVQYYSGGAIFVDVTHWMPLPQPPEGE